MNKTLVLFASASILLLSALVSVVIFDQASSWQEYQKRYFEQQIYAVENKLKQPLDDKSRGELEGELDQLKTRQPAVVNLLLPNGKVERCQTCHLGLEEISPSHPVQSFGCTICHGGNPLSLDIKTAHASWNGNGHPGSLSAASLSCGGTGANGTTCHSGNPQAAKNEVDLVPTSIMSTKVGELSVVRQTFGLKPRTDILKMLKGQTASQLPTPLEGNPRETDFHNNCLTQCHQSEGSVPPFSLAPSKFRQLSSEQKSAGSTKLTFAGCETCHVLANPTHTYVGQDVTIPKDEQGYGMTHRLTTQIPYTQCNQCHNQGLHDLVKMKFTPRTDLPKVTEDWQTGNQSGEDRLKDYYLPGELFAGCEVSLDCIDCHTRQDVMGDGHQYTSEYDAVHIQCQDCHGTKQSLPLIQIIKDPKDLAFDEKITNPVFPKLVLGDKIVVTHKGEELPFVRNEGNSWHVVSRVTGKVSTIPLVKGSSCQQKINEQGADACHKCHSSPGAQEK